MIVVTAATPSDRQTSTGALMPCRMELPTGTVRVEDQRDCELIKLIKRAEFIGSEKQMSNGNAGKSNRQISRPAPQNLASNLSLNPCKVHYCVAQGSWARDMPARRLISSASNSCSLPHIRR